MAPLNMVMQGSPKIIGARVKSEVWESLRDWIQLIKSLGAWPTSVHKLVATSMRSVVPAHSDLDPFVWRVHWPPDFVNKLVTWDGLSISDIEYGGVVLQQVALKCEVSDLRHKKQSLSLTIHGLSCGSCDFCQSKSGSAERLVKGLSF